MHWVTKIFPFRPRGVCTGSVSKRIVCFTAGYSISSGETNRSHGMESRYDE